MKSRSIELLYGSDLHATRLLLGVAEFVWALALFWPGDTFGRPTYHVMAQLASEQAWGLVFLVTGVIQFYILLHSSYHTRFAVAFAGFNAALWIFTVLAMYMSVYPPPAAISGELAMAFGASWVFIRAGVPCIASVADGVAIHTHRRKTDGAHG